MKRLTSGFLAAAETVFAALTGLGIAFVPLVLLWAVQFHLQPDLALFTRAAANIWLLGHGVDLRVVIDPSLTAGLTLPGANAPFVVSLAPLGFALVTAAAGWRIGYRSLTRRELVVAGAIAVSGYTVISGVLGLLVGTTTAQPDAWQSLLLPPLVMMTGVLAGACRGRWSDWERENRSRSIGQPGDWQLYPLLARAGFRAGRIAVITVVGILGVAALLVTFSVVVNYATMVGLAGSLGAQGDGQFALFVGQLMLLPNVIVWAVAWLLGPGFSLGIGSHVSAWSTLVDPVPGIPLLGALPRGNSGLPPLWLLIPCVLGFVAVLVSERARFATAGHRVSEELEPEPRWLPVVTASGSVVIAAAVLGSLSWAASGGIGPGRLAMAGPVGWDVAVVTGLTVAVGVLAGYLLVWNRNNERPRSDGESSEEVLGER